jgi:NTE family protein
MNKEPLSRRGALVWAGLALAGCQTTPAPTPSTPPPAPTPPSPAPAQPVAPAAPPAVAAPKPAPRIPRIGLALGGGAARGFAHIGVIQALETAGIRPSLVVGTSAGSLVAALYAAGKTGLEMAALATNMDESAITDWTFPGRGLLKGEGLAAYVREHTGGRAMEQMKLPLGIVATDLATGEPILFQRGDTAIAVRASSAVPAVFQPVKMGDKEFVDGGLVSPVPVRFARQMGAEIVIAVDISSPPEGNTTDGTLKLLLQTFAIMGKSINRFELREADVVVRPKLVGVGSADFASKRDSIHAGRDAMNAAMGALKAKLAAGL